MAKFKVPHDAGGNQITYAYSWQNTELKEPYEFEATLVYNGYSRGRSALNIEWMDINTNKTYQSGMTLLSDALLKYQKSEITGKFSFKKQGTSVLLILIKE